MNLKILEAIGRAIAQEPNLQLFLKKIVLGLIQDRNVALARIWLIAPGDNCSACRSRLQCGTKDQCLHLHASAGRPLNSPGENWSRLNGEFARIPLGNSKVGLASRSGTPVHVSDVSVDWTTRQEFAEREGIRGFAAQPIIFRGETLGALAVFTRFHIAQDDLHWLRSFADHAAVAVANSRILDENRRLRGRLSADQAFLSEELDRSRDSEAEMIGNSVAMQKLAGQIALVAPTEAAVLIYGESGTGKEVAARAIHQASRRRDRALISVNCSSIPRELFESEFFGHTRGAFTGALRDRMGRFEAAHGGTLLLDEVGEIPFDLQSKLLRVLQEGQYERVGEDRRRQVNVRIIAATNRNLRAEVERGNFREDLYYRLSVFPIETPTLRSRKEDIEALARYFLRSACARLEVSELPLGPDQLTLLQSYHWPGNVRELQNAIERAVILGRKHRLQFGELLHPVSSTDDWKPSGASRSPLNEEAWQELERENLRAALRCSGGRVGGPGGAAELLGIQPTTLRSRLKSKGIQFRMS